MHEATQTFEGCIYCSMCVYVFYVCICIFVYVYYCILVSHLSKDYLLIYILIWSVFPSYCSFLCLLFIVIMLTTLVGLVYWLVVWRRGSALVSINEVTLRRARLVLGWVTGLGLHETYLSI